MLTVLWPWQVPCHRSFPTLARSVHHGSLRRTMKHCSNPLNLSVPCVDFGDRLWRHGAGCHQQSGHQHGRGGLSTGALALAPEHGWLTEAEAETQALNILQEILNTPNIAKHGLYYHWIDAITGAPRPDWDGVLPWIPLCSMPEPSWPVHALVGWSMTLSSTCCWRRTGPNLS